MMTGVSVTPNLAASSGSLGTLTSPKTSFSLYVFERLLNRGAVAFFYLNSKILFLCGLYAANAS